MNAIVKPGKLIKGQTGDWEVVIGLEVHAQVTSKSKLFSGASTEFGGEPNSHVSLVDAAMPGMLPVINEECVIAVDLKMLDRQRPVMRRHLLVVLLRDRIGRAFGAALEHFRLFLQDLSLRHGSPPVRQVKQAR